MRVARIHNRKTLLVIARRDSSLLANPPSRLSPFSFPFLSRFWFLPFRRRASLNATNDARDVSELACIGRSVFPIFTRSRK